MLIVVTGIIEVLVVIFIIAWLYNTTLEGDKKVIYTNSSKSSSKSSSRRSSSGYSLSGGYYGSNSSGSYGD